MVLVGLGGACSANADCAGGTYHHPKLKKALLMSGFRLIGVGVRIRHASHCRMSGRLASQRGCCVPRNYSRQVCQQGIGNRNVHELLQHRHGPDVKGRRNSRCVHDPLHRAGLDDGRERQPHRRECRSHKQGYRRRGCDWGGQHQRCGEVGSWARVRGRGPLGDHLVAGDGMKAGAGDFGVRGFLCSLPDEQAWSQTPRRRRGDVIRALSRAQEFGHVYVRKQSRSSTPTATRPSRQLDQTPPLVSPLKPRAGVS